MIIIPTESTVNYERVCLVFSDPGLLASEFRRYLEGDGNKLCNSLTEYNVPDLSKVGPSNVVGQAVGFIGSTATGGLVGQTSNR